MTAVAMRLGTLGSAVVAGVRRFPLPLGAGLAGAVAGSVLVAVERRFGTVPLAQTVLLTSWLGVPLLLALALSADRAARQAGAGLVARLAWHVAGLGVLAAAFATLWGHHDDEWLFIRFALWFVAVLGLVALAPVVPVGRPPRGDFRAFNLMLFSRTALALLLTHVLWAGLSFALAAIHQLFDLPVPSRVYPQLWFALMGVFNTAYVLAGIPRDWERLEGQFHAPRALDVLARQVLLPLSVLYLAILYVYSAKIIVVHEWPRGWVSAPIIAFAAVGLLTVLLLGPERDTGTRFVRAYCRGFFFALLPLVLLLFLAISRRALEYGLTEERCLVYAIAVFLGIVAPYFVLSRGRHLAFIPLALSVIALLTSVGPTSARALSVRSQTARVRALLEKHHRLEHGVLVRTPRGAPAVPPKDEAEISGALRYLESRGELGRVMAWRASDRKSCPRCAVFASAEPSAEQIVEALGMEYRPWGIDAFVSTTVRFTTSTTPDLRTTGYDLHVFISHCTGDDAAPCQTGWRYRDREVGDGSVKLFLDDKALRVEREGRPPSKIPLVELAKRLSETPFEKRQELAPEKLTIEGSWSQGGYRLHLHAIEIDSRGSAPRVESFDGQLLLRD